MHFFIGCLLVLVALFCVAVAAAFVAVGSKPPPVGSPRDIFGFEALAARPRRSLDAPALERYRARDGEDLAYRFYDSSSDRILVFIHGSSYHGGGYHTLARAVSAGGFAKAVLPNLRGHHMSGRRRGDVEYIGQLEDDIADLVAHVRERGCSGPITLGGHSSGGGFVIRFAGGPSAPLVSSHLLLAPAIPTSKSLRGGTAGGWSRVHMKRLLGLLFLDAVGVRGFDGLTDIEFAKPAKFWDGTETLSYSHRLNSSYHPRYKYSRDLQGLSKDSLVLVGADDQAVDPAALQALFETDAPQVAFTILPDVDHFGVFESQKAIERICAWLSTPQDASRTLH